MKNVHGESNAKLNLNIEADPEPEGGAPTFIEKPRIESSADGKLVTMLCKVKADPKPSVVWTRETLVVKESSRISITIVQDKDSYAIKLELKVFIPFDYIEFLITNQLLLASSSSSKWMPLNYSWIQNKLSFIENCN